MLVGHGAAVDVGHIMSLHKTCAAGERQAQAAVDILRALLATFYVQPYSIYKHLYQNAGYLDSPKMSSYEHKTGKGEPRSPALKRGLFDN